MPSHSDLIEMAASQSIQEDAMNNGGVEVVKKVNINFSGLKLNDSKKRGRQIDNLNKPLGHTSSSSVQPLASAQASSGATCNYDMQCNNEMSGVSDCMQGSSPNIEESYQQNNNGSNSTDTNDYTKKIYKAKRFKPQPQ